MNEPVKRGADPITVRLMGGLGNQLFQYAAGRAVATRLGVDLYVDVGFLKATRAQETQREFALGWLVPEAEVVRGKPTGLRGRMGNRLRQKLPLHRWSSIFSEESFAYDPRILEVAAGSYLIGYFQSWRYFDSIATELRATVLTSVPQSPWLLDMVTELGSDGPWAAIHIRRGDYVTAQNAGYHGLLNSRFYEQALARITRRDSLRLVVFSDDPAAVSGVLGHQARDAYVVHPPRDSHPIESLALMSRASVVITANSSFSWWGAWLAGPGAQILCPEPWFNGADVDERDLRPRHWQVVKSMFGTDEYKETE